MKVLLKLFSLKLIAVLLGLLYSVLQVNYFGASRTIEIFFASQSLVLLITSLTQSGQLAEVFLPEYHRLNNRVKGLGYKALNVIITRILFYLLFFAVVMFFLAPKFIEILVPGFSHEDKLFSVLIFRVLIPVLFFQVVNSFFVTVLNADQKFGKAELLGLTNTIVNLASLIILYPIINIWSLVVSLLLGKVLELFFYTYQMYKSGYRYRFIYKTNDFNHNQFFKVLKSTFLYVGATQIYKVVLTSSISFLPEGVYAIYNYTTALLSKLSSLLISPFMTIFFTTFSKIKSVGKQRVEYIHQIFYNFTLVNILCITGVTLFSKIVLTYIWQTKMVSADDITLAYKLLIFGSFSMLISSYLMVYRKINIINDKSKIQYRLFALSQLIMALITFFLLKYFSTSGLLLIQIINALLSLIVVLLLFEEKGVEKISLMLNYKNAILFSFTIFVTLYKYFFNPSFLIQILMLIPVAIFVILEIYKNVKQESFL